VTITVDPIARKDVRLAVRLRSEQDSLIRDAAAASGQTMTEFVTAAAVERAHNTLADRRVFRLDDQAWAQFTALLDRPAQPIRELSDLLNRRAPWEQGD
jgi:uncharacterized protein (DUF1778 family)